MHSGFTYQGSVLRYRKDLELLEANAATREGSRAGQGTHRADLEPGNTNWHDLKEFGLVCTAKDGKQQNLQQYEAIFEALLQSKRLLDC